MIDLSTLEKPTVFKSYVHSYDLDKFDIKNLAVTFKKQLLTCYGHNGKLENHVTQDIYFEDFLNKNFDLIKAKYWQFKNLIGQEIDSGIVKKYASIVAKYLSFTKNIESTRCTFRLQLPPWYFPYHFDAGENLFLNLYGKRQIKILSHEHGQKFAPSLNGFNTEVDPNLEQIYFLNPGDAIFIPAGYFHEFTSVGENLLVGISTSLKFASRKYIDLETEFKKTYQTQSVIVESKKDFLNIKGGDN